MSIVNYTDVDINNISYNSPETKPIPNQPGQSYSQIMLNFNYGTEEMSQIDNFYLQFPLLTSNGIIEKTEANGKTSYSMYSMLPLNNQEVNKFIEIFDKIYNKTVDILAANKGPLKLYNFTKEMAPAVYKNPIYYPRDKVSGERLPGRSPSMYFKLFKRTDDKTLFTDLQGNQIDWKLLNNVDMKYIPLIQIEKIYVGAGKPSLQLKMVSAIVTELTPRNGISRQATTIETYNKIHPEAEKRLSDQIAKLTMERQDLLNKTNTIQTTQQTNNTTVHSSLHDFISGGTQQTQETNTTMPNIPTPIKLTPFKQYNQ